MNQFKKIILTFIEEYDDIDLQKCNIPREDTTILRDIFVQVATQGLLGDRATNTADKIEKDSAFPGWDANALSTSEAKDLMLKYLKHDKKIDKIIKQYKHIASSSVSQWIKDLKSGIVSMGLKSDDDFLKDHGYFDRIPIDRFYPPFLARTGILYDFIKQENSDPAKYYGSLGDSKTYNAYKNLIISECKNLYGITVDSFDLSKNPGVVDFYIWRHCASSKKAGAKNICGSIPKCKFCIVSRYCDFGSQTDGIKNT